MFRICAKHFLTLSLFIATSFAAAAQNTNKETAPYSRYGIGELQTGTNVMLRGMGYTSTAYNNAAAVNTENPASYSFLKLTTYEAGFTGGTRSISAGDAVYKTGSASFAYVNVGIPIGKNGGVAFGVKPQSRIYYHVVDSASYGGLGRTALVDSGDGGLNYAYVGGAIKRGGFSLGFNFGYMFGTVHTTSRIVEIDTVKAQNSDFTSFTRIGGLYWKGGAQYTTDFNNKYRLNLGATAAISQSLRATEDNYVAAFHYESSTEVQDTAYNATGKRGNIKLPLALSFGAGFSGTNWAVYADFNRTQWGEYRRFDAPDSIADATMKFSVGGEFTPDPTNTHKYGSRVTYRAGLYYGNDYVKLRNTDINYYGATLGASLPFKRGADRIHVAIEAGRHGTETNNLIQENYFRVHLGISLNDKWFIERKYD